MILKNSELRDDIVVMLDPNSTTTGGGGIKISEAILSRRTPGETPAAIYHPGDPICYMAACSGKSREIALRIVYLLNKYGFSDKEEL